MDAFQFRNQFRFLSNFEESPVEFEGDLYPTVEHAFQAAKCANKSQRKWIRDCPSPGSAKSMGRTVALRTDWEQVKDLIMLSLVRRKFAVHDELADKLIAIDGQIAEGNYWHDTYWGVDEKGVGQNKLGKILMQVRDEIIARRANLAKSIVPDD